VYSSVPVERKGGQADDNNERTLARSDGDDRPRPGELRLGSPSREDE
jgi:hypothetical protein